MLVLARKCGEAIRIADNITVRVLEVKGGLVKLGIEAPRQVAVHREEVLLRIQEENKQAAIKGSADLSELAVLLR